MYEEFLGIDVLCDFKEKLVMLELYLVGISEVINWELREMECYKVIREGFFIGLLYIYMLFNIIGNELNYII